MNIDFNNPPIAEGFKYKAEEIKAICTKSKGEWVCTAYVETEENIVVCAISYGKKRNKTLKEVLNNAVDRSEKE